MHMRDELGTIYQEEIFAPLFSHTGQPAEAPWRLALVTSMHFAEGLSDRQAADAVRGRIDWKYADGGSNSPTPALMLRSGAEFRTRLVEGQAEEQLLTVMLTLFKERGWRHPRVVTNGRIRRMCWRRFAPSIDWCVWEKRCAMRFHCLAMVAPEWLLAHSQPEWVDRYGVRLEDSRLPSGEEDRQAWVEPRWTRWSDLAQCPL